MGRKKDEGPKNLVIILDKPRFQRIVFTRGSSRLPFLISDDRLDGVVNRFEQQGWTMEREGNHDNR